MIRTFRFEPLLLAIFFIAPLAAQQHLATVPFVGCAADRVVGPFAPPTGSPKQLAIPANVAAQLAYYKPQHGRGVLGPRGWSCIETGLFGGSLFLTPEPMDNNYFSSDPPGPPLSGPAIVYAGSGPQTVARVFPHYRPFVEKLITQGIAPASYFHFGPFPADKLTYKSDRLVEFVTPSGTVGLGTQSWLAQGHGDITGFAMIIVGNNLNPLQLSIRLPPTLATLGPVIIKQSEHEAAQPNQGTTRAQ